MTRSAPRLISPPRIRNGNMRYAHGHTGPAAGPFLTTKASPSEIKKKKKYRSPSLPWYATYHSRVPYRHRERRRSTRSLIRSPDSVNTPPSPLSVTVHSATKQVMESCVRPVPRIGAAAPKWIGGTDGECPSCRAEGFPLEARRAVCVIQWLEPTRLHAIPSMSRCHLRSRMSGPGNSVVCYGAKHAPGFQDRYI